MTTDQLEDGSCSTSIPVSDFIYLDPESVLSVDAASRDAIQGNVLKNLSLSTGRSIHTAKDVILKTTRVIVKEDIEGRTIDA